VDEAALQKIQPTNQPDTTTLNRVLQFLLPTVGTVVFSSRLLSLLSLDWVNAELDLGLEFENRWEAELTSSTVVAFFSDCFASYDESANLEVDLEEVEDLVIPAMYRAGERQLAGRSRLYEIANRVLKSGRTLDLDWVPLYEGIITNVFTSGPSEVIERCQRRNDRLQQERNTKKVLVKLELSV
jgi:hypothetical protein